GFDNHRHGQFLSEQGGELDNNLAVRSDRNFRRWDGIGKYSDNGLSRWGRAGIISYAANSAQQRTDRSYAMISLEQPGCRRPDTASQIAFNVVACKLVVDDIADEFDFLAGLAVVADNAEAAILTADDQIGVSVVIEICRMQRQALPLDAWAEPEVIGLLQGQVDRACRPLITPVLQRTVCSSHQQVRKPIGVNISHVGVLGEQNVKGYQYGRFPRDI